MVYFKLGRLASTFFDSISGASISGKEVIALRKEPKNKKFQDALRGNHITFATEAEFIKAGGKLETAPVVEEDEDTNEFITKAKKAGFDEEDLAAIQAAVEKLEEAPSNAKRKKALIELEDLYDKLEENYGK